MIVVSLLLILVAVVLLVLGLADGSSMLLISSIGASLLAAVALVIGARRAAAVRRAALTYDVPADPNDRPTLVGEPAMAAAGSVPRGARRQADPAAFADDPPPQDEGLASTGPTQARAASRADAEEALAADAAYREAEYADDLDAARAAPAAEPDYDRASSVIGSARRADPNENAWRREHAADTAPRADEPLRPDGPQRPADDGSRFDAFAASDPSDDSESPGSAGGGPTSPASAAATGLSGGPGLPGSSGLSGGSAGFSDDSDLAEEFGDPDEDDPADEPLPQAVRPADAVRVARMNAEVLVVDGRPRYHLADCPHLVGRLTESLPVAEAVELGFSPCGQCRPVDRLVARAARH